MKKFLLTLGFTAAAGLALSTSALAEEGLDLAKKSGCLACHAIDKKVVGPAWQDVADKYKGATEMTATLTDGTVETGAPRDVLIKKTHKGGKGNWTAVTGGVPMPPYSPRVADADIEKLVDFVLSLAK